MLAILGHLVTSAGNRLPGEIAYGVPFASVKSGLAAFSDIPTAGLLQLVFIKRIQYGVILHNSTYQSYYVTSTR